jgi:hypothetical protein
VYPSLDSDSISRKVDIPHITTRNKGIAFFPKKMAFEKLLDLGRRSEERQRATLLIIAKLQHFIQMSFACLHQAWPDDVII